MRRKNDSIPQKMNESYQEFKDGINLESMSDISSDDFNENKRETKNKNEKTFVKTTVKWTDEIDLHLMSGEQGIITIGKFIDYSILHGINRINIIQ